MRLVFAVRLFVAVNLPAEMRQAAYSAAAPLREGNLPIRWVASDALHITLKFLGDVEEERARAIGPALGTAVAAAKPFEVTLGGFGAFPDEERPRVVWIGVERHPALELLANDVERALAPLGFDAELRPFQPHLTLGRSRGDARPAALRGLPALAQRAEYDGVLRVESVDLMESRLGPAGATYHVVHRAPLGRGGA